MAIEAGSFRILVRLPVDRNEPLHRVPDDDAPLGALHGLGEGLLEVLQAVGIGLEGSMCQVFSSIQRKPIAAFYNDRSQ